MAGSPINVTITGDYNDRQIKAAIRDLQSLQKDADATGKGVTRSFGDIAGKVAIAGAAIAGVGAVIGKAISAASDLAESQSKATVVFGDQADAIMAWSKTSATAFGQTQQQALEAAGTYGNLFQAFGLTQQAATKMSTTMVELAADLASFNNTSIDDAIEALRSGLSGETEPLKRFGIALNDARMKQEALALGIYNGNGALDAAQKAQAAYAVILNDTTLAQGDFARTSDGLANQQRILQANFGNLVAELGTALLPVALQVVSVLNTMVGVIGNVSRFLQENAAITRAAVFAIASLTLALNAQRIASLSAEIATMIHSTALMTLTGTAGAATGATTRLALALRGLPLIALATGLYMLADAWYQVLKQQTKVTTATANVNGKIIEGVQIIGNARQANAVWAQSQSAAAKATTILANSQIFAKDATDEQTLAIRAQIGAIDQYIPMALSAADAANAVKATSAETNRYTAQAKALGAEIGFGNRGLQRYAAYLDEVAEREKKAGGSKKDLKDRVVELDAAMRSTLRSVNQTATSYDVLTRSLGADDIASFSRKMLSTGKITMDTKDEFEALVGTIRDRFNTALDAAKQKLGEWQAKYDGVLTSVEQGIRSGNGIADAVAAQAEATQALADAQKAYDEAVKGDDPQRLADATAALDEARAKQGTFLKFLQRGADSAQAFGDQIQQLIKANAALEVVQDIAALGAKTGSRVAAELLAGGAAAIDQANRLVLTVGRAANDAGVLAAQTFYGAGLASAQAYVSALETQVRPLLQRLLDDIAAQIRAALNVKVNADLGGGPSQPSAAPVPMAVPQTIATIAGGVAGGSTAFPQVFQSRPAANQMVQTASGNWFGGIRLFADGGLVMRPTMGIVGEAGPEAVIPLSELGRLGSGTNITINVNAGMGTDGAEVGRKIVDALKQYERRNGPVPITVA